MSKHEHEKVAQPTDEQKEVVKVTRQFLAEVKSLEEKHKTKLDAEVKLHEADLEKDDAELAKEYKDIVTKAQKVGLTFFQEFEELVAAYLADVSSKFLPANGLQSHTHDKTGAVVSPLPVKEKVETAKH